MKADETTNNQPIEKQMIRSIITTEKRFNSKGSKLARTSVKLTAQLSKLLGNAKTHPEIRAALPNCQKFFKSLTSEEFVILLNSIKLDNYEDYENPVYIALWYHHGDIMRKAINKCALGFNKRMILLYPLFRFYADESDTYI